MKSIFQGSMTALVTPFRKEGVDEEALRQLVEWQIASGTHILVPCGTTGEAPALSREEHKRVIRIVVEQAKKRVPVLAGCGSNNTDDAIHLTKQAKNAGADGTLQVTPYYNKPTQRGLFLHFEKIAAAVPLPMILYNVPGRTGVNLEAATTLQLSKIDSIVGIKEACGRLEQIAHILQEAPKDFAVLSGDDALNLEIYKLGGRGCISVTANLVPGRVAKVWNLHKLQQAEMAAEEQESLQALNRGLFMETNPIPVKTALAWMGRCAEEFRLPLCPLSESKKPELLNLLKRYQLLEAK